jgi:hypothetical protein
MTPDEQPIPGLREAVMSYGWEAFFNQLQRIFDHIDNRLAVLEYRVDYDLRPFPGGLTDEEFNARMEFYGLVSAKGEMGHWPCLRGVLPDDPELAAAG